MTGRQFYDWQTAGGADDVMRMVDAFERAELHRCAIGGIARLVEAHPGLRETLPEDVARGLAGTR
jgi:hypothetical protein